MNEDAPCYIISQKQMDAIEAEVERLKEISEKYSDLLYQVAKKIPGETRHETARRIINQHETRGDHGPAQVLRELVDIIENTRYDVYNQNDQNGIIVARLVDFDDIEELIQKAQQLSGRD